MSFLNFLFGSGEQREDISADETPSTNVASPTEPVVTPPPAAPVIAGPVVTSEPVVPEKPIMTPPVTPGTPVVGGGEKEGVNS